MNKFKTAAIYISLMVFSFSVYAAGEVEYVWLTVRNAMSGEPIEGVSITVDQAYIGETGPLGRILIPEGMPGQLIALYHTSYAAGYYSRKELQERDYEVFLARKCSEHTGSCDSSKSNGTTVPKNCTGS